MTISPELEARTIEIAQSYADDSEDDLLKRLARQDAVIQKNKAAQEDPALDPNDEEHTMALGVLKSAGLRIMREWNKRLYKLVCESADDDQRNKLVEAFGLGRPALIGAVATLLLTVASPAIAAAAAPLIVIHFLEPAGGVLCDIWEEQIDLEG